MRPWPMIERGEGKHEHRPVDRDCQQQEPDDVEHEPAPKGANGTEA